MPCPTLLNWHGRRVRHSGRAWGAVRAQDQHCCPPLLTGCWLSWTSLAILMSMVRCSWMGPCYSTSAYKDHHHVELQLLYPSGQIRSLVTANQLGTKPSSLFPSNMSLKNAGKPSSVHIYWAHSPVQAPS